MTTGRRRREWQPSHRASPVWRPLAWSAVTTAAIAALFSPLPAAAAPAPAAPVPTTPGAPVGPATPGAPPVAPTVPDAGLRPVPLGSLVMPGQTTSTPIATTPVATVGMTPLLARIEKARAQFALLGDRLLVLNDELAIARGQVATAARRQADARAAVVLAEQAVTAAAADAFRDAAAMPPGTIGSDLEGLGALAGIQRGEGADERAAGRHLQLARETEQAATAEHRTAAAHAADLTAQHTKLTAEHRRQQAALQKLEQDNVAAVARQEAAERAQDLQLGAGYVANGSTTGKAADPRALAAVGYALSERGDPYVWSTEGPDTYDCSGLMWAAYRTAAAGRFQLPRVSRDQYNATKDKSVDRYSLLPGDLLFFSHTSVWTGIHHVAMYAGNGMMVEAPRTGLSVRLVPVRWTRLFAATRIYGPVTGPAKTPPGLNDPQPPTRPIPSPTATTPSPAPRPTGSRPPVTTPTTTKPPPRPKPPSTPPTRPNPPGTTPPVATTPPPTPPGTTPPGTTPPATTPTPGSTSVTPTPSPTQSAPSSQTAETSPPSSVTPSSSGQ